MKVVINACYGGFSLSPKAVQRLAELQGRRCYLFSYNGSSLNEYIPYEESTSKIRSLMFAAFDIPNPSEVLRANKDWHELTDDEKKASNDLRSQHQIDSRPENRADPLLVQVVEELGEAANGACAKLKVVEIPDGVDYEVDEYDGFESIHEKHRSWS